VKRTALVLKTKSPTTIERHSAITDRSNAKADRASPEPLEATWETDTPEVDLISRGSQSQLTE
jgi:hypothetical protein